MDRPGWWNRTSPLVNDWLTNNESQAVEESQNSKKRKIVNFNNENEPGREKGT